MDNKHEQVKQITDVITNINNKDFKIYYFTLDTKGNPTAGIANIYEHVKILTNLGYKAYILHEKNDYKLKNDENGFGIEGWLGEEYIKLPHASIENKDLNVKPEDFLIIPEVFSNIMDQVKSFPCKKIVLSQSYDYLLELLPIGKKWNTDYHFNDVITTSEAQAKYIKSLFPTINTEVIPVSIPKYFKESGTPKKPIVSIFTRNQGDASKIAKTFYLQNPIFKWITFKELRNLSREDFAKQLQESFLSVWVDDQSGFGTFPLESMECGTPVIGKIPNLIPEWMVNDDESTSVVMKNNGIWVNTTLAISEAISNYIKMWIEDSLPIQLFDDMKNSVGKYTEENQVEKLQLVYEKLITDRVKELNNMLENINK